MKLVPSIASSLASLTYAQSPSIRAKMQQIQDREASVTGNEEGRAYSSIRGKLSLLVYRGLHVNPLSKPRDGKKAIEMGMSRPSASDITIGPEIPEVLSQPTQPKTGFLETQDNTYFDRPLIETGQILEDPSCDFLEENPSQLTTQHSINSSFAPESLLHDRSAFDRNDYPGSGVESDGEYDYVYALVPMDQENAGVRRAEWTQEWATYTAPETQSQEWGEGSTSYGLGYESLIEGKGQLMPPLDDIRTAHGRYLNHDNLGG